jgi:DNA-binding NarL/FixJ family response regulator
MSRKATRPSVHELLPAEREVLRLIACGLSHEQIATARGIKPGTVRSHATALYQKLGVASKVQATLYALAHGIVTVDEAWTRCQEYRT